MKLYLKAAAFAVACTVAIFAVLGGIGFVVVYFHLPDVFFGVVAITILLLGSLFYAAIEHLKNKERAR